MVETVIAGRWFYRMLFVGIAAAVLFVQILPLGAESGGWAGPDLILALTICWGLRRPDYLPTLLAGAVLLMADLILQRPPGLWAGLVILALELLRARNQLWRDLPFPVEWALVSALMAAVVVLNWLVLALFLVPQTAMGLHLIQLLATIAVYPLVAAISAYALGVRKIVPGQVDALGHWL